MTLDAVYLSDSYRLDDIHVLVDMGMSLFLHNVSDIERQESGINMFLPLLITILYLVDRILQQKIKTTQYGNSFIPSTIQSYNNVER